MGTHVFTRAGDPSRFWLLVCGHVAVMAIGVLLLSWRPSPRAESGGGFYGEVEPVLDLVRSQLPGEEASFTNVRIDADSRRVCGEAQARDGPTRRFFGQTSKPPGFISLEQPGRGTFDAAWRRWCGAPPLLPAES